jgi:uncharacterized damage-inducible protein DinB
VPFLAIIVSFVWSTGCDWLQERRDTVLTISTGPNGDRFPTVGELVKHIFIPEKHHIDRLSNRPMTDTDSVSSDNVERLFQFDRRSRKDLREFVEVLPPGDWDVPREFNIVNNLVTPEETYRPLPHA